VVRLMSDCEDDDVFSVLFCRGFTEMENLFLVSRFVL